MSLKDSFYVRSRSSAGSAAQVRDGARPPPQPEMQRTEPGQMPPTPQGSLPPFCPGDSVTRFQALAEHLRPCHLPLVLLVSGPTPAP